MWKVERSFRAYFNAVQGMVNLVRVLREGLVPVHVVDQVGHHVVDFLPDNGINLP